MIWKVLGLTAGLGWPVSKAGYEKIGAEYVEIPCQTEEEIIEATSDADAVFAVAEQFTRRVIKHMRKCRLISVLGIGYDHVDVDTATKQGICVSNVPGYCVDELSDHAMALLLACARKIVIQVIGVRDGGWDSAINPRIWAKLPPMFKLRGQTLGIVGLGRIGRTLVPKAKGFGMKVIAYDPYLTPEIARETGVELVELDYLLEKSDFISVHALLNNETRHMFRIEQFRKMKPTAFFINCARGGLVDDRVLYVAVSQNYIAGAGLDVLEPEPPMPDNPLLKLDNVLVTPHSSFYSEQAMIEVVRQAEEEVFRVLGGDWPLNLVNPEVKEKYTGKRV